MHPGHFDQLRGALVATMNWDATTLVCDFTSSSLDGPAAEVDLVETIGKGSCGTSYEDMIAGALWFGPDYSDNTKEVRDSLRRLVYNMCKASGFVVHVNHGHILLANGLVCYRFRCYQGVLARPSKSIKQGRTSAKPKNQEQQCPCQFCIYYDDNNRRWFFPRQQAGSLRHEGHAQEMFEHLPTKKSSIDSAEMKLIYQQLGINSSNGQISRLFVKRTGSTLSKDQIKAMRQYAKPSRTYI